MTDHTLILDALQVQQKINRFAHQLLEENHLEPELIIVGISKRGYELASRINEALAQIAPFTVRLLEITLDKDHPLDGEVVFDITVEEVEGRAVVLVDDVLNSGRTLIYAASHILQAEVKKLTTVVLVDRRHRRYPVRADHVGLTLSTTLQEHITVELYPDRTRDRVFLS